MYFFLTTFTIWIMFHFTSGATYLGSQLFNASTSSSMREYCERENFEASCPPDHVVIMRSGRYGRMDVGRCVNTDYGHMGCEIDVLTELDRRCSGRKSCSFPVTELQEVGRPCPTDLMSYLEASYSCLPVIPCSEEQCAATHFVHVNPEDGYLSSAVAGQTGCGTQRCPWLLEALPGQKVNLTAYYFSTQRIEEDPRNPTPRLCHRFVTIRDNGLMKDLVSCEHEPRSIGTYVSQSHRVEVRMHTGGGPTEGSRNGAQITVGTAGGGTSANDVNFVQFVLKYEVIGCPLVRAPQHGYIALQSDSMVIVRCNHSEVSWRLMCLGTSWDSTVSSCPAGSAWEWQGSEGGATSPHGMLIVIAIGIALGIAAGFLMLGLAVIYFKRRHMLTRHRIPIPQCDMHEPEKLMTSYPPIPEHKQEMIQTGNGTVTRPYVQHSVGGMKPVIPEYNVLTQDQAYHPGGGDGEKPCAFIYQGNNYGGGGGYTLAQHVYESPTFERKGTQPLNPSDFTNATGNNNTHIVVNAANMNNSS